MSRRGQAWRATTPGGSVFTDIRTLPAVLARRRVWLTVYPGGWIIAEGLEVHGPLTIRYRDWAEALEYMDALLQDPDFQDVAYTIRGAYNQ